MPCFLHPVLPSSYIPALPADSPALTGNPIMWAGRFQPSHQHPQQCTTEHAVGAFFMMTLTALQQSAQAEEVRRQQPVSIVLDG